MAAFRGKYLPKNPQKYRGDFQNIIHRSGWERQVMKYLDDNPMVVEWSSEELAIPYISPKDGLPHRYFPDFIVTVRQPNSTETRTFLWEVKPHAETLEPKADPALMSESAAKADRTTRSKKRRYVRDVFKYAVNRAKWNAAIEYCVRKDWTFHLVTEKHLRSLGK